MAWLKLIRAADMFANSQSFAAKCRCLIQRIAFGVVLLAVAALGLVPCHAGDVIPILKAGPLVYTNVEVLDVTPTDLFIRHAGGLTTVKLANLDSSRQKQFGYDPAKAEEAEIRSHFYAIPRMVVSTDSSAATPDGEQKTNNPAHHRFGNKTGDYLIGNTGTLTLDFPSGWKGVVQRGATNQPPAVTITFEPAFRKDFLVTVTTIPQGSKFMPKDIRQTLEIIGKQALTAAVEKKLDVKELQGTETQGLYFVTTDQKLADELSPKPGTYKHQTQGLVTMDGFVLSFAILDNYEISPNYDAALDMIRSAHFTPAGSEPEPRQIPTSGLGRPASLTADR